MWGYLLKVCFSTFLGAVRNIVTELSCVYVHLFVFYMYQR